MSLKLRYVLTPLALPALMTGLSIGLTSLTAQHPTPVAAEAVHPAAAKPDQESTKSSRGYLGVSCQRLTGNLREVLEIPRDVRGVLISDVVDGSAADRAGLRNRDVVLSMNGQEIDDEREFTSMIRSAAPGDKVALTVWRDGKGINLTATLDAAPTGRHDYSWSWSSDDDAPPRQRRRHLDLEGMDEVAPVAPVPPMPPMDFGGGPMEIFIAGDRDHGRLGVQLQEMNEDIAEYFAAPGGKGALIWKVMDDSPAAKAGLKAGDVIVEVEGEKVDDYGDLQEALDGHDSGDKVAVTVLRRGQSISVTATLDEGPLEFGANRAWAIKRTPRPHGVYRVPGPNIEREVAPSLERIQRQMERLQLQLDQMKQKLEKMKD